MFSICERKLNSVQDSLVFIQPESIDKLIHEECWLIFKTIEFTGLKMGGLMSTHFYACVSLDKGGCLTT